MKAHEPELTQATPPPFIFPEGEEGIALAERFLSEGRVLLVRVYRGEVDPLDRIIRLFFREDPPKRNKIPFLGHLAREGRRYVFRVLSTGKTFKLGAGDTYEPIDLLLVEE